MPPEQKCEIDFLALEQFIGRRVQLASESCGNCLALDMLCIRHGNHFNPGRFQRIKIERDMPMADLQQSNSLACSPLKCLTTSCLELQSLATVFQFSLAMSVFSLPSFLPT